ncbi:hypothetical protein N0V84_010018 [Fusarium piperis]|uniref:Uncharacterized protein n=1 Tax=Fusarium piperis TaxID=1435070 RepID=A0A9W9BJ37_9HYPO|nr:hypothetical protein N0V84_010018 [Fusarium piperis]
MFGSSQGYPRHNPSPLSDTPDNQVVTPIQALTNRVVYLEQQSLAPQMRRIAEKNARNSVIRVFMDPGSPSTLGTNSILDKCQRASHPFNLVIAVQRPLLAPEGEVLLIVRSDEDAEQIRSNKGQLSEIFGVASYFCPERFYITPSVFTKDDLVRMSTGEGAKHDYCELFKNPHEQLTAWRNETGLDIKKADWRHGYLWLLLNSIDEAREAVSGKVYSLGGFQTQFM